AHRGHLPHPLPRPGRRGRRPVAPPGLLRPARRRRRGAGRRRLPVGERPPVADAAQGVPPLRRRAVDAQPAPGRAPRRAGPRRAARRWRHERGPALAPHGAAPRRRHPRPRRRRAAPAVARALRAREPAAPGGGAGVLAGGGRAPRRRRPRHPRPRRARHRLRQLPVGQHGRPDPARPGRPAVGPARADPLRVAALRHPGHRWGTPVAPVLPGLVDRPSVQRELIPYGSPPSANLLNAFDLRLQERTAVPASFAPIARLLRAGDVLVQSDLQYERYNTPRPRNFWALVTAAPGLGDPVPFGPGRPNETIEDVQLEDELLLQTDPELPHPPELAVFPVEDPLPIVATHA